ncbi:hypothetical protein CUMW_016200 [Citrus unshiu]|nr:hypothetical protein CUMW_016200 [Citrus unshiu]
MSYFCGSGSKLVRMMSYLMIIIIFLLEGSMAEEEEMSSSYELSTREELVQMAGYGEEKLSTVLVTGSVLCEACLHGQDDQLRAWPITGALVSVYCHNSHRKIISKTQTFTDEYGDFMIDLPSHLHATPNLDKTCSVKVLRLPKNSHCRPAYVKKHKGLKLSSVGNGIRTYAAGRIGFLHWTSKPLRACTGKGINDKQIAW